MANEFKIKNALQIINSQPVQGISDSSIFTNDTSTLATKNAIKGYVEGYVESKIDSSIMLKSIYDPMNIEADSFDSINHNYDNTISEMEANNVQDAIDEIYSWLIEVNKSIEKQTLEIVNNVNIVSGTPDTITLDFESIVSDGSYQIIFKTDSISDDVTLFITNDDIMRFATYHFRITGTVVMTFGGSLNWVSDDAEWDNIGKTYTFAGGTNSLFEIFITKIEHADTQYYKIKFSGEQI